MTTETEYKRTELQLNSSAGVCEKGSEQTGEAHGEVHAANQSLDVLLDPSAYCGVILAAGYSSRMKSFKPLLPVGDMTAIERSIAALIGAGVRNIIVVTGHNREKLEPVVSTSAADMNVIKAYNENFADGMFSSIKTGLAAVRDNFADAAGVFLMPVDCPLISSSVITDLIMSVTERSHINIAGNAASADDVAGKDVDNSFGYADCAVSDFFCVPVFEGKKGHPLMIPSSYIDEICSGKSSGGLKAITDKYWDRMIRVPVKEEGCLLDMDTPQGYEEIKEFLAAGCRRKTLQELAKGRRIFLVRHGQTRQHEEKMFIGRYDVPLAENAEEDILTAAAEIRAELAKEPKTAENIKTDSDCVQMSGADSAVPAKGSTAIYASPLKRAMQTATIISGELGDLQVHIKDDLQEISLGKWDGRPVREIREQYPEEYERRGRDIFTFKTGNKSENFYDVQYRAVKALSRILECDKSENIIIVTHSAVIRSLENNLRGSRVDDEWTPVPKGGFRIIEL